MTFVITAACIDVMDQSCMEVCPVDCIYIGGNDRMSYIHPDECIDCAACESACPVGAIFAEDAVPTESVRFVDINREWFESPEATREVVDELAPS